MEPDTGAKTHLTFGGSTAHRWLRCPGSVRLCATIPPQPENEHMAAGTRAHALLELALKEGVEDATGFVDWKPVAGQPGLTEEDVAAVQVALDHVHGLLARDPDSVFFVERHVTLSTDVGGTSDVVVYLPSTRALHVIDYKHGRRYVEAEGNPQIKLYAAAALFGLDLPVETVHGTIIQPRAFAGDAIRTAVYGPADLLAYTDEVEAAVEAARAPAAPFSPGEEQCHWCPAAHVCPALRDTVGDTSDAAVAALSVEPETDIVVTLPSPDRARGDPQALADTLKAAGVIREWLDAIEAAAYGHAMSGQPLPGFKLVEKRASRRWADAEAAQAWLADRTMLDEDDYAPRKLLSVAQIEKKIKAADPALVKDLGAHIVRESSGLNLVPETAKGEAVNPLQLAASAFAAAVTI